MMISYNHRLDILGYSKSMIIIHIECGKANFQAGYMYILYSACVIRIVLLSFYCYDANCCCKFSLGEMVILET